MTSYWPAIFFSIVFHVVVIFFVVKGWDQDPDNKRIKPPSYIKATLVEIKAKSQPVAPVKKAKPEKSDLQKKQQEQERLKKIAKDAAHKKQLARQKEAKQKAVKEKAAKEKAAKEKAREKQQKKRAEQRKKQQEKLERQALEKRLFEESLTEERERIEAEKQEEALAQQAKSDELLAQSYSALVRKRVEQNWSRPLSLVRKNMETLLSIRLIPTGEVIHVAIKKSSGNAVFDRSAIQAVKKARQFPELKELSSRVFEQNFRQLTLQFKPQD